MSRTVISFVPDFEHLATMRTTDPEQYKTLSNELILELAPCTSQLGYPNYHSVLGDKIKVSDITKFQEFNKSEAESFIISCYRGDRFCDGYLQESIDMGLLLGALKRLAELS